MNTDLLSKLERAVRIRNNLSLMVIVFSLPEFKMDGLDWAIWAKELRN